MDALDGFLDTYGVAAACAVMLVKAAGVPIPIPGDVILLATAARAAEGKVILWLAFVALLVAIVGGGLVQYLLARGPARSVVMRYGARLGLTESRLDSVAKRMRQGGPVGVALAVLTPGVRTAVIPACGITNFSTGLFVTGLAIGSAIDLTLHFAIGFAGASVFALLVGPSPLIIIAVVALVGLGAWLYVARRRRIGRQQALNAWIQATCPVCLALGAVRLESAA